MAEARKIKSAVELGDEIRIDVTSIEYGRIAAQSAKQVILQRLQEAEQHFFNGLKHDKTPLLTATVSRVEGSHIFWMLKNNCSPYATRSNCRMKTLSGTAYLCLSRKVQQTSKGPQLKVSERILVSLNFCEPRDS